MTTNTIDRESARERRWTLALVVVLAAAGFLMTIYSAAMITGLIVRWLADSY